MNGDTMNYSKKLKEAVINYVKDERLATNDEEYTPTVMALPKKEHPKEYNNYKTDWVDEDDFLVEFKDIIKIINNQEEQD